MFREDVVGFVNRVPCSVLRDRDRDRPIPMPTILFGKHLRFSMIRSHRARSTDLAIALSSCPSAVDSLLVAHTIVRSASGLGSLDVRRLDALRVLWRRAKT